MRRVLHHPDFQAAEAIWRGVEFLVRRIETGARMEIVLYDVSAEEFAADLAATDALEETGLYGMLVEQPALDAHRVRCRRSSASTASSWRRRTPTCSAASHASPRRPARRSWPAIDPDRCSRPDSTTSIR